MPDNSKKFHEFALKSILFKGRTDWYFCYLKAERIAHVIAVMAGQGAEPSGKSLAHRASELPQTVLYLAAGESDAAAALADVFALLSEVRIATTAGIFTKETGALLSKEYEEVAQRLAQGSHPSPFVTSEDFKVAPLPELEAPLGHHTLGLKDTAVHKMSNRMSDRITTDRMSLILDFIKKHKQASIKDIALVVKGCSEKTIQRELGVLIDRGLVKKVGERRWSLYLPA